jgi:hypothetical protein
MVRATHSSSMQGPTGAPIYAGSEAGFMIEHGGRTIYFSGDTDVMADMALFEDLHRPEVGHPLRRRAFHHGHEARGLCGAEVLQLQDRDPLPLQDLPAAGAVGRGAQEELPGVNVIEPEVLKPITL